MKKIFAAVMASTLVACGSPETSSPETSQVQQEAATAYTNIVAVSSETADLALKLVGPENLAAINEGSKAPTMGTATDLARQVEATIPVGTNPDAEQILSYKPDLVLLTARHGGEKSVGDQLESAGVNVVEYQASDFDSPESLASTIRDLSEKLGVKDKGEQMASEFESKIADVDKQEKKEGTFAALMARGGKVMAMSDDQVMAGLAARAGGTNTARATMPIDAEQLVAMNPEVIYVEDFMGQGLRPFEALLSNPALAQVPAIKNDRVVLLPMTEASAVAGVNMAEGYAKIKGE